MCSRGNGRKFKRGQSVLPFGSRQDIYEVMGLMPELPNGEPEYRARAASNGVACVKRDFEIRVA